MRIAKRGNVKQLVNKSINYSAFLTATLIPSIWLLFANLVPFILRNEGLFQHYRLAALATGLVWGSIVAWATNVPQVLYFYRPGGKNKAQRRLFVMSALGLLISLSALALMGVALMSYMVDVRVMADEVAAVTV